MIPNSSKRSSLRRHESSFEDQNNDNNMSEVVTNCLSQIIVTNSQSSDHFGVHKSTELRDLSQQLSQSSIGSVDNWKGSQVTNYKTFKKCSQNSSQNSIKSEKVIPLKRVQNDSYKQWLQSIEHKEDIGKSNKRKIDSIKEETITESNTPKKSRF